LCLWILQNQPGPVTEVAGVAPVDGQQALGIACVGRVEEAGQRGQQRALPGAGRSQQQYPLSRFDDQVESL
jgi:hypothetical protein